ncbi:hypothetical protein, partial [Streptomyces sp. NPDC012508]|uniref:wHTH domain-containing protein n=1 Tax=Streptomyces sp. NPDC012508 TaxID=3364837 RepID=UPI003689D51D
AHQVGCRPEVVAARLVELGLRLPEGVVLPETADPDDLLILSRDLDRQGPWLAPGAMVSLGHVLLAAGEMVERDPELVAARLAELGMRLPEGVVLPETVDPDDLLILSESLDREGPWLDSTAVVPLVHVLRAAHQTGRDPEVVAASLVELGLRFAEGVELPKGVNRDDLALLFRHAPGNAARWLDRIDPVRLWDVARVARSSGLSLVDVAQRLGRLGITLAPDVVYEFVEPRFGEAR